MSGKWEEKLKSIETGTFNFCNVIYEKMQNGEIILRSAIFGPDEIEIPEGVVEIGSNAFMYSSVRNVKFPNSLKIIGSNAFFGCDKIESVELPAVEKIKESAFALCKSLKEVKLHEGLISIGRKAFAECEKLEKISLPSSVIEVGFDGFGGVSDVYLKEREYPSGFFAAMQDYSKSVSIKVYFGKSLLIIPKSGKFALYNAADEFLKNADPEKEDVVILYKFANYSQDRQEIALEGYSLKPDPKTKAYLRKYFLEMLSRTKSEEDFLSLFGKFNKLELLTKSMAEKALSVAQEKKWAVATAGVLEETKRFSKRSNRNTKRSMFCI